MDASEAGIHNRPTKSVRELILSPWSLFESNFFDIAI